MLKPGAHGNVRPLFFGGTDMGYFIIVGICGACWLAFEGL
jgi:hypothetical protein